MNTLPPARGRSRVYLMFFIGLAIIAVAARIGAAQAGLGDSHESTRRSLPPVVACESLTGKTYFNVHVAAAAVVPASTTLPGYCRVSGTEHGTDHDVEVRLPESWLERYVQEGGSGFDGRIRPNGVGGTIPLRAGAVQVANNGGHRDPSGAVLLNNPRAVERYAHSAILTATAFGKAVTKAYYGRSPRFSYYEGCSNGGRGALNAAAKYGDEFDGVIAGAPLLNTVGQIEQWTRAATLSLPAAAALKAINAAVVAKCDLLDGVRDGIVSNWAACQFDPTRDVPTAAGVTASEAAAVKTLLTDLTLSDRTTAYSGAQTGDVSPYSGSYARYGVEHLRNIVLNDPTWSPAAFDATTFYPIISKVIEGQYQFSPTAGSLAQFLTAGRKIIVWHGSGDVGLSYRDTIRAWQDVIKTAGVTTSARHSRLYIAPGVNHCGNGSGADTFDLLTPLMTWVEQGTAPETVTASKRNADGSTRFSRPMCVYPAFPRYKGMGDVNDADSFVCATQ